MTFSAIDRTNIDSENQHWLTIRIYYEDTDFTGMVYHANYLKYFERGRSDFLREAGVTHRALLERDDSSAFTLIRAEIDYKNAARVEDVLNVRTRYLGTKGPRILFDQSILREGQLVAQGVLTVVMIHADGRARKPLPELVDHLSSVIYQSDKS